LYYYCKNCVNKAKETFVYVDDNGEFRQFAWLKRPDEKSGLSSF
jgi:hypothetical protein